MQAPGAEPLADISAREGEELIKQLTHFTREGAFPIPLRDIDLSVTSRVILPLTREQLLEAINEYSERKTKGRRERTDDTSDGEAGESAREKIERKIQELLGTLKERSDAIEKKGESPPDTRANETQDVRQQEADERPKEAIERQHQTTTEEFEKRQKLELQNLQRTQLDLEVAISQAPTEAFIYALHQTVRYMKDRKGGAPADANREFRLSEYWTNAGRAVEPIYPELATSCYMKSLGWTDPEVWERAEKNGVKVGLAEMENALVALIAKRNRAMQPKEEVPSWFPIVGALFAVLTVGVLIYMLLIMPVDIPDARRNLLNLFMAFCVACSAAFIGGSAVAGGHLNIPVLSDSPIKFSAVGGVGVFVVVYLILRYTN